MLLSLRSLSLCPQLFPERIHQSVDERELQQDSCVCADILLGEPECGLSALPGPDLRADWVGHLCDCEYISLKKTIWCNLVASTYMVDLSKITIAPFGLKHVVVWMCRILSFVMFNYVFFFFFRTVFKEQLGLQTQLQQLTVLLDLYRDQRKVSIYTENNISLFSYNAWL